MSTISLKSREDRVRRELKELGYRLHKTPARSRSRKYYGVGYQISRDYSLVDGCSHRLYEMTLEDVEYFVAKRWDEQSA
jgi:hypothetical protein